MVAKKCILLVEDDQSLSSFIKLVLEKNGCEVHTAFDGEEAVQLFEHHKPDLVLLDVLIPKMTGWDVIKYIRQDENLKEIPVVVMSNLDGPERQLEMEMSGANEYVVKVNLSKQELLDLVTKYLA